MDNRVRLYIEMEDPDIVLDLRSLHSGTGSKFNVFWEECAKYLQEDVGLAAEERRHSEVTHLARVISVWDLLQQVSDRCPPIPSRSGSAYNSGLKLNMLIPRCTILVASK